MGWVQLRSLAFLLIFVSVGFESAAAIEARSMASVSAARTVTAIERRLEPHQALAEINAWRAAHNLPSVRLNPQLMKAAAYHSKDMSLRGMISHRGRDGSRLGQRLERVNYAAATAAENVSAGQRYTTEAIEAWKKSPAHNEALLSENMSEIGIGMVYAPETKYRTYWTLLLAEAF